MIVQLLLSVLLQDLPSSDLIMQRTQKMMQQTTVVQEQLPASNLRVGRPPKKLVVDGKESFGVDISAQSAIVVDAKTGAVLFGKESFQEGSIASLTKLMTAMVFLDHNPGWDVPVILEQRDERAGAATKIYRGDEVTVRDLFNASLIASDNNSTMALVRSTGLGHAKFVELMNAKAVELGLEKTSFVEPTGLNAGNRSSAYDLSQMIYHALQRDEIQTVTSRKLYTVAALNSGAQRRLYTTDQLLDSYLNKKYRILGGKTGFTYDAGACLGIQVQNKEENNIIVVVMGAKDKNARFHEVKGLTEWTFENYSWN